MMVDTFDQQLEVARRHLEMLWQRTGTASERSALVEEALEELSIALQELQVATEELRLQNTALAAARHVAEAERQRYQALFEFAPDAYVVTNTAGMIQEANVDASALFQVPRKYLVGKPLVLFVHASDHKAFYALLTRLQHGAERQEEEMRLRPRRGAPVTVALGVVAVRDDRGHVSSVRWLLRNMTKRQRMEESLGQALAALSHQMHAPRTMVTESLHDAVYTEDLDGRITYGNAALERLTGRQRMELLGHPATELYAPHASSRPVSHQPRTAGKAMASLWEGEILRQDGTRLAVEVSVADLVQQGKIIGHVSVIRDITARQQLEEQRCRLQKMEAIGRLAAGVAHDYNNLLQVIRGYSELLLPRLADRQPLRRQAQQIKNAVEQAALLTRRLLTFSRKRMLQVQAVDLNQIIASVTPMLQYFINEDIHLVTELEPALGLVKADPGQLEQMLLILAANARDAMPQGGQLCLTTANVTLKPADVQHFPGVAPGEYVWLTVQDTGYGMDGETLSHLYEPFFTTKPRGKGMGLGLATVYGIVTQSGGCINVDSAPAQGTTVTIDLPEIGITDASEPPLLARSTGLSPRSADVC